MYVVLLPLGLLTHITSDSHAVCCGHVMSWDGRVGRGHGCVTLLL